MQCQSDNMIPDSMKISLLYGLKKSVIPSKKALHQSVEQNTTPVQVISLCLTFLSWQSVSQVVFTVTAAEREGEGARSNSSKHAETVT